MEPWTHALALLLIPPGAIVVVGLLGFLLHVRWPWPGKVVVGLSIAALLVFSAPLTGKLLLADLEHDIHPLAPLDAAEAERRAGAIVVLGGDRYADAPEYGEDSVGRGTLERLRYAVRLQRETRLPILVSGGAPHGERLSEATMMQAVLKRDFHTEARWVESDSSNTFENAEFSFAILNAAGIKRIFLVTHAWHLPRALWSFRRMGFDVVPAPTGFATLNKEDNGPLGYLPAARGLLDSAVALRERLGLAWYRYRYRAEGLAAAPKRPPSGAAK